MVEKIRKLRGDRGSGPVTVLLILAFLILMFTAAVTAVGTLASNESAGAQHAADAASLAGAAAVVDTLPAALVPGFRLPAEIPELLGGGTCLQTGQLQAAQLAAQNQATLTHYCYDVYRDQVSVRVTLDYTNTTKEPSHAQAKATAATTFEANACSLDPSVTLPTPTPAPAPAAAAAAAKAPVPPPLRTWVECGFGRLAVVWNPALSKFQFLELAGLPELLTPKLVA